MSPIVVLGGGLNGLVAAATLAKAGRKVILLERRAVLGGTAAGAEFHPGYRHTGVLHDSDRMSPEVVRGLGLGVSWRAPSPVVAVSAERSAAVALSPSIRQFLDRLRPFVRAVNDAPAPDIGDEAALWPLAQRAWGFRRLGPADMQEILQIGPMPVDDWLAEHVSDPQVRAALCWPGLLGTWMGPRSPTSMATWLFNELTAGQEVVGGPAAVVNAVIAALSGVDVRTGVDVTAIRVENGAVTGVVANGASIDASAVLCAIGPRRALIGLLPFGALSPLIERDVADIRVRGIVAKVHLALSGPVEVGGQRPERFLACAHPLDWERAFDDAKMRRLPSRPPPLDVRVPTVVDPSLAPPGHSVASILVHGVPYDLDAGWTDAARDAVREAVLSSMEAVSPGIRDRVVAAEVLTPADLEQQFGLEGGHLYHGEHALDQLWVMRPTAPLARHEVPGLRGLYLGSAGTHPGGGVTGLPGWLAAKAVR